MLSQINTMTQVANTGLTGQVHTRTLILSQLNQLDATGNNAVLQMTTLINAGGENVSPQLLAQLGSLLQQNGDNASLTCGLTQLLSQYGSAENENLQAMKSLACWLGGQLNQTKTGSLSQPIEKQIQTVLRQLGQGNHGDDVKNALAQVLQGLRQSSGVLNQPQVSDKLQILLQQARQEMNAQGQNQDPQFANNITEFALRLNQQLTADDAARQIQSDYQVQARQQDDQSRQHRQQQQQTDDDEDGDEITVGSGTPMVPAMFSSIASRPTSSSVAIRATSAIVGGSCASRSVSGTSLYEGDSVFSYGLDVLFTFMQMLSDQANSSYAAMQNNSNTSRDAQGFASTVDGILADVAAKGDSNATATLPDAVTKYIEDNHLEISGICGYDDSGQWKWIKMKSGEDDPTTISYSQGDLTAIKGALDNVANRASDFISTAQLQLQKMMQTYNVCVSLINSLQTMLADMNKTIAQGIR